VTSSVSERFVPPSFRIKNLFAFLIYRMIIRSKINPLTAEILNVHYDPLCRVIFKSIKNFTIILDHEKMRIYIFFKFSIHDADVCMLSRFSEMFIF
jgi:hypothetical protein